MMNNRCEKFVQEENKEVKIDTSKQVVKKNYIVNVINDNYMNPPIPEGYKHVAGKWNNGFIIKRESDRSQFVWVPVGMLDNIATLDGENFNSQFGRINFQNDDFSKKEFNEPINDELLEQCESIKKYGGFYISRYAISKNSKGNPQSVKGSMPWVHIKYTHALEVAASMENRENIKSHLAYGAEYDTVLSWFIKTGAKTIEEIAEDSTDWGNHKNSEESPKRVVRTGERKHWCVNNIYDFAGNTDEWTQEQFSKEFRVLRGGTCNSDGRYFPVAYRDYKTPNSSYGNTSFRVVLCIK